MIARIPVVGDDDVSPEAVALMVDALLDSAADLDHHADARWMAAVELDADLLARVHAVVVLTVDPAAHLRLLRSCQELGVPVLVTGAPTEEDVLDLHEVRFEDGTVARALYATGRVIEPHPPAGPLGPGGIEALRSLGFVVSATGERDGDPRVLELPDEPFLLATAYAPHLASNPGRPHPLLKALVAAAVARGQG